MKIIYILSVVYFVFTFSAVNGGDTNNVQPIMENTVNSAEQAVTFMMELCSDIKGCKFPLGSDKYVVWTETGRVVKLSGTQKKGEGFPIIQTHTFFFPKGSEQRPLRWSSNITWLDSGPSHTRKLSSKSDPKTFEDAAREVLLLLGIQSTGFNVYINKYAKLYQYRIKSNGHVDLDDNQGFAATLLVDDQGNVVAFSMAHLNATFPEKEKQK